MDSQYQSSVSDHLEVAVEIQDLRDINCMEIINDPTYPDGPGSNDMAIRFLDQVWNEGIRVFGVGGSDSHNLGG